MVGMTYFSCCTAQGLFSKKWWLPYCMILHTSLYMCTMSCEIIWLFNNLVLYHLYLSPTHSRCMGQYTVWACCRPGLQNIPRTSLGLLGCFLWQQTTISNILQCDYKLPTHAFSASLLPHTSHCHTPSATTLINAIHNNNWSNNNNFTRHM